MENETNGLTFGEICHMIVKRIWYVLGATVGVAIIAVLIVHFALNPAQRWYSMQFNLVFPTGENTAYPDGEPFFYQNMVSAGQLQTVKAGEGLTDIDTDRMVLADGIEISAETRTENGAERFTGRYTVRVKSSYFSGKAQAEAFIRAIADTTVNEMRAEAGLVSYKVSKETFDKAPFEERLNLLAQERETILGKYDEWIAIYDASYQLKVGETEQSLKEYRATVTALFGESKQRELEDDLTTGGYYFTDDFEAYLDRLEAEYDRNEAEIAELKTVTVAQTGVSQRLVELIERNNTILYWLGGTLTKETNNAFAARIEAERAKLEQAADLLTDVTEAIYDRGMTARFDVQTVDTEGGIGVILVGIAAAVVAFLVACVVVCAVESGRKKKAAAQPSEETPGADGPEEKNG